MSVRGWAILVLGTLVIALIVVAALRVPWSVPPSPRADQLAALRDLPSDAVARGKEFHRNERSFVWLEQIWQMCGTPREVWRRVRDSRRFAGTSLAFGIEVNAGSFTLVKGILLIVKSAAPDYQVSSASPMELMRDSLIKQDRLLSFLIHLVWNLGGCARAGWRLRADPYSVTSRTMSIGAQRGDLFCANRWH